MLIPSKQANLIRKASGPLFINPEGTKNHRIRVFYRLIRPLLSWLKKDMMNTFSLCAEEAESEIYIFCSILYNKYNPTKSSIIPFLLKFIPLYKTNYYKKLNKTLLKEEASGLISPPISFVETPEEYYYTPLNIVTEERYVGKSFTFSIKYIINRILMLEPSELNNKTIAEQLNLSRQTLAIKLEEIATIWRRIYETTI
jgi:hypothetical protein